MMSRMVRVAAIVVAATAFALGFAACQSDEDDAPARRSASALTDLTAIDQLKTRFNRDRGSPRLVVLLSPT